MLIEARFQADFMLQNSSDVIGIGALFGASSCCFEQHLFLKTAEVENTLGRQDPGNPGRNVICAGARRPSATAGETRKTARCIMFFRIFLQAESLQLHSRG